jgi:hypothetical protein
MVLIYVEFKMRGLQTGSKFGSAHVQTKSFNFLRKFTHGKSFKFPVCYIKIRFLTQGPHISSGTPFCTE